MDRRQQKTRRAIFEAFTRLLETRSYGSVTVQEIIDAADVGRSTFYAHFETKDALLRAMCTDIFDHVFSHVLEKEATHDFSNRPEDIRGRVTHILHHLNDNRRSLKGILSGESGEVFMRYFKEYLALLFEPVVSEGPEGIPADYLRNHMICDFAEAVRWWLRNDGYSPEEISRFFLATSHLL